MKCRFYVLHMKPLFLAEGQVPSDAGKVDNHVSNEQAHHAKDAPAGAHQR